MKLAPRIAVAALAASAALAAPAGAAQARFVVVLDGSLRPATVTVPVGGSVTWIDLGRTAHRIVSDTRAWPTFTLKPGKRHAVRFARTGRYRYHVDGKRLGLVVVVAHSGSGSGTTTTAAGGEGWVGTFTSADTNVGTAQTCRATWKGKLSFTVGAGKISGSGEASLSGKPSCSVKLPTQEISHVTFTVVGSATSTTLKLLMHLKTIQPAHAPFYDAGGFLLHFGKSGEGVPFDLPLQGASVDAHVTKHVANVTLRDHFTLAASK